MLRFCQVSVLAGFSFISVVSVLESLGEWFHFVLFLVFQPFPPFAFPPNMSIFILFYFFHIFHRITLEIMTLQPKCEDVETAEGVAITVTGVAQVNHHTCLRMPVQTPQTPPHSLSPCPPILSLSPPTSLGNHSHDGSHAAGSRKSHHLYIGVVFTVTFSLMCN